MAVNHQVKLKQVRTSRRTLGTGRKRVESVSAGACSSGAVSSSEEAPSEAGAGEEAGGAGGLGAVTAGSSCAVGKVMLSVCERTTLCSGGDATPDSSVLAASVDSDFPLSESASAGSSRINGLISGSSMLLLLTLTITKESEMRAGEGSTEVEVEDKERSSESTRS